MLSIFAWFGYKLPKKACFDLIRQAGFDGTSLWWNNDVSDDNFYENPEIAKNAGLFIENIHAPFEKMNYIWEDNLGGEAVSEYLLKCVDDCCDYEIPVMVMHSSFGETEPVNEIGLRRFDLLIERAEQKNINIALENMRKTSLIKQTTQLLERFDSERLGFCYDSGHDNARQSKEPEFDLLDRFGNRLMMLHLHDNESVDDQHLLPFDGTTDWKKIMKRIANTGYTGTVSLEVHNTGYESLNAEEFLKLAFERAKKLELITNSE